MLALEGTEDQATQFFWMDTSKLVHTT